MTSRALARAGHRGLLGGRAVRRTERHAMAARILIMRAEVRQARRATHHVRAALEVAVAIGDNRAGQLRAVREELRIQRAARDAAERRVAELETPRGVTGERLEELRRLASDAAHGRPDADQASTTPSEDKPARHATDWFSPRGGQR